jgi:hypothetical protein
MALGDPAPDGTNYLKAIFWIEIAVFVVVAVLFYRVGMKDGEV